MQVSTVAAALPVAFIPPLITTLSDQLQQSAHLEFVLRVGYLLDLRTVSPV